MKTVSLSPRSYSIQFQEKRKYIFLTVTAMWETQMSLVSHPLLCKIFHRKRTIYNIGLIHVVFIFLNPIGNLTGKIHTKDKSIYEALTPDTNFFLKLYSISGADRFTGKIISQFDDTFELFIGILVLIEILPLVF